MRVPLVKVVDGLDARLRNCFVNLHACERVAIAWQAAGVVLDAQNQTTVHRGQRPLERLKLSEMNLVLGRPVAPQIDFPFLSLVQQANAPVQPVVEGHIGAQVLVGKAHFENGELLRDLLADGKEGGDIIRVGEL